MGTMIRNLTDKINISFQNGHYVSQRRQSIAYSAFERLCMCLQLKHQFGYIWIIFRRRELHLVTPGMAKVLFFPFNIFLCNSISIKTSQKKKHTNLVSFTFKRKSGSVYLNKLDYTALMAGRVAAFFFTFCNPISKTWKHLFVLT